MENGYEAPELTLIGQADEMILGVGSTGPDLMGIGASDFEFEED